MSGKRWSAVEDRIVEREYPYGASLAVQKHLPHRSRRAIVHRASFLAVPAKLSEEDRRLIISLYPSLTKQAIADKFDVHVQTIYRVFKEAA